PGGGLACPVWGRNGVSGRAERAGWTPEVAGWYRRGGRRCTVHVTAEEFAEVVHAGLIEEFGPWRLTGSDATAGADGGRVEHPWVADEVTFDRYGHKPSGAPRINMWVWSPVLTRSHPPLSAGRPAIRVDLLPERVSADPGRHGTDVLSGAAPRDHARCLRRGCRLHQHR